MQRPNARNTENNAFMVPLFRGTPTACVYQRRDCRVNLAPEVGFEPTTNRLTADRSTTELLWID